MIIPIRCMSCGKVIADKWRKFQEEVKKLKKGDDTMERYYFDGKTIPETPEKVVMDSLKLTRSCCRKHFLTQVDLMEKV
jgi:DNA-directed RNA polymerase I, II, and III subunit RPABC5